MKESQMQKMELTLDKLIGNNSFLGEVTILPKLESMENLSSLKDAQENISLIVNTLLDGNNLITCGSVLNRQYLFIYSFGVFDFYRVVPNNIDKVLLLKYNGNLIMILHGLQIPAIAKDMNLFSKILVHNYKNKVYPNICVVVDSDCISGDFGVTNMSLKNRMPSIEKIIFVGEKVSEVW